MRGWTVGTSVAALSGWLRQMWTAGLEYRHYDFDHREHDGLPPRPALPAVALEPVRFDATTDTVMARVSWRWGREPAAAPLK